MRLHVDCTLYYSVDAKTISTDLRIRLMLQMCTHSTKQLSLVGNVWWKTCFNPIRLPFYVLTYTRTHTPNVLLFNVKFNKREFNMVPVGKFYTEKYSSFSSCLIWCHLYSGIHLKKILKPKRTT